MSDLFVDRLGDITVANGVARLDLMRLSALNPEEQTRSDISQRLVIPLDELMQAVDMLNKIREELNKEPSTTTVTGAAQTEPIDRSQ